jgi:hypothetical protein
MNLRRVHLQALAFVATLAAVGVGNHLLTASGYDTAGSALYAIGYGSIVVAAWYVWLRPLNLTGGQGTAVDEDATEE